MALYALDDLDDALAATRRFLLPVDVGTWLRLAFVAVFVGSLGGAGGGGGGGGDGSTGGTVGVPGGFPGDFPTSGDVALPGRVLVVIAALVVLAVVVGVVFVLVGSVMEFVLVESLRRREVHVRRYVRRHWRLGLRLFAFRLLFGLLVLAVVGGVLALGVLAVLGSGVESLTSGRVIGVLLVGIPVVLVVGLLAALVTGFTTVFVVPIMLLDGRGVLSAWRRFWPTLVGEWRQYLVYAVAAFVLRIVAGIVIGIVLVPVAIVLFLPVGIGGFLGFVAGSGLSVALVVVLALGAFVATLLVVGAGAIVEVPFLVYLRYYALFVLGDTDEALDLVPTLRREVRESPDTGSETA